MLEDGYIKLHRSLLTWEWYKNQNTKDVFLHLLLTANFYDEKFEGMVIKRGQRVWSRQSLAKELSMSEQSIRTAINHLISTNELTNLSTPKYSVITINNYEKYQALTSISTNDQPTINQPSTNDQPQSKKARKQESKNIEEDIVEEQKIPYSEIQNLYASICRSYPKIKTLSESRKKAIHARIASGYSIDDFKCLFEEAESSAFLKGKNDRNWSATFDWLIKDTNMAKVLEGNYKNRGDSSYGNTQHVGNNRGNDETGWNIGEPI